MVRSGHKNDEMEKSQTVTAQFRFETGHELFEKHLQKLGIPDLNKCTLCATEQNTRRNLQKCPELENKREALPKNVAEPEKESHPSWKTRKRMMPK
jgi:hypothetical protein